MLSLPPPGWSWRGEELWSGVARHRGITPVDGCRDTLLVRADGHGLRGQMANLGELIRDRRTQRAMSFANPARQSMDDPVPALHVRSLGVTC